MYDVIWKWEILLSIFGPTLIALTLFTLEARGPLSKPIQASTGIVAPYFSSIAVLFSLFAALLAHDAWQKDAVARQIIDSEHDAIHALAALAVVNGVEAVIVPSLRTYVEKVSKLDPKSSVGGPAHNEATAAHRALMGSVVNAWGLEAASRTALLAATQQLLYLNNQRFHVATDEMSLPKWLSVLGLGAVTQIALMLVHVSNRRAMRVAVGLFTVAVTFCLLVISVFDDPYRLGLVDEPHASLHRILRSL
jgi:hypothetical protein